MLRAAGGVAVGTQFRHSHGGFAAKVGVCASLHYGEETLAVAVKPAAQIRGMGPPHPDRQRGLPGILTGR